MNLRELNRALKRKGFVPECERGYEAQIKRLAREIFDSRGERPVLLISGPSGSGKTTAALRIEKYLDLWGAETHVLAMDDYFEPLTERERELSKKGELDLESPERVDSAFLREQLEDILACRPCRLPEYDFARSARMEGGRVLERKPGELVVLEGIHAFNPAVLDLPDDRAMRILVRPDGELVKGSRALGSGQIRLLRRMGRDRLHRGRTPAQTLSMYPSVERGTLLYEQPWEKRAHRVINSFMPYEPAVWRAALLDELLPLCGDRLIDDIVKILKWIDPMEPGAVPDSSPLREFM